MCCSCHLCSSHHLSTHHQLQHTHYIGEVAIGKCIGGARGVKSMLWETSNLHPAEGIRFSFSWLLLTIEVPTKGYVDAGVDRTIPLPAHVRSLLDSLPKTMHPMTQLKIRLAACQTESKFSAAYGNRPPKSEYHTHALEDISLLHCPTPGRCRHYLPQCLSRWCSEQGYVSLDCAGNFYRMLGDTDHSFDELMRVDLCIHTDHEGGNASAHTTHLVGSTLAVPYSVTLPD